jgi:hypothetical protein
MDPVLLPPPYGGMNDRVPRVAIQFPQCESLINFNVNEGGVSVRAGDYNIGSAAKASTGFDETFQMAYFNNKILIFGVYNASYFRIYDYLGGAVAYTSGLLADPQPLSSFTFKQYLFITTKSNVYYYDGTTYGLATYSPNTDLITGSVYKARVYFTQYDSASYRYSEINAIAGTLHEVSLAGVSETASNIAIIAPISISDVVQSVNLLAFVFESGEVLFYSGTYPDSSDWTLVGSGKISSPISHNASIAFQGDVLIMCIGGVYSLREIFTSGNKHGSTLLYNADVNNLWIDTNKKQMNSYGYQLYLNTKNNIVSGVFDDINNRIIILYTASDASVSNAKDCLYFIYNVSLNSWYVHQRELYPDDPLSSFCRCDILMYPSTNGTVPLTMLTDDQTVTVSIKEGATDYSPTDAYAERNLPSLDLASYDYEVISAPLAAGRQYINNAVGLDVILETDMYEETDYRFIKDLGAEETAPQSLPVGPTDSIQKPFVNMGIEGVYVQYKISGTTARNKSIGLNIYGTNVWLANGSSPR